MKIQLQKLSVMAVDKKDYFFQIIEDVKVIEITEYQYTHILSEPDWDKPAVTTTATFQVMTHTIEF